MNYFKLVAAVILILVIYLILVEKTSYSRFIPINPITPNRLAVATYNIQYLPWKTKSLTPLRRVTKLYPIILLQECFNRFSSLPLNTLFPEYYICRGKMKGLALVNSGLVTLSQYPIVSYQFIQFKRFTMLSADALSNKGFLACVVQLPTRQICFINTHLQSCEHSDYDPIVKDQIREIFQYARGLNIPYVIGGDFNINYTELNQDLYSPAVINAPREPTIYINLVSGESSSRPTTGYSPYTFDYFFVHPSLSGQQVVSEQDDYSDHNPTFFTLDQ